MGQIKAAGAVRRHRLNERSRHTTDGESPHECGSSPRQVSSCESGVCAETARVESARNLKTLASTMAASKILLTATICLAVTMGRSAAFAPGLAQLHAGARPASPPPATRRLVALRGGMLGSRVLSSTLASIAHSAWRLLRIQLLVLALAPVWPIPLVLGIYWLMHACTSRCALPALARQQPPLRRLMRRSPTRCARPAARCRVWCGGHEHDRFHRHQVSR